MANTKIPSELIADSSITAAKLADGTITTADIANSNVTTAKIADSGVTTAKIGDAQVTTAKITDANVTTGKIADDAVTTAKMASNSVTSDTIASGITLAGLLTVDGGIDVDNFHLDGTALALSSGDMTLDSAGDIILDADGGDIYLNDGGTGYGQISGTSGNLTLKSATSNKDIIFQGVDGGSQVFTALTLDMSAAGAANFNAGISIGGTEVINSSRNALNLTNLVVDGIDMGGNALTIASGDLTVDVAADIILDAGGNEIKLKTAGTEWGQIYNSSSDLAIYSSVQDKDIKLQGNDGGSVVTALTLDMSAAGAATFNAGVTAGGDIFAEGSSFYVGNGGVVASDSTSRALNFAIGNTTPKMTLDTSGNVKIKTTADYFANDLVVGCAANGGITVVGGTSDLQYLMFADGTSGDARYRGYIEYGHNADAMSFGSAGQTRIKILSDGKVGIGTAEGTANNPFTQLEVSESHGGSAGTTKLRITSKHSGSHVGQQHLEFAYNDFGNVNAPNILANIQAVASVTSATNVGGILRLATKALGGATNAAPVTRMTVIENGNIGVGIDVPLAKFHIKDTVTADAFRVENFNKGIVFNSTSGGGMYSEYQLVGTAKFRIGQANHLVSGASASDFAFQAAAGNMLFATGTTERMRLSSSGDFNFNCTSTAGAGSSRTGVTIGANAGGLITIHRSGATALYVGRSNDGEVVALYSGTAQKGTISISGSTTTYGSVSDARLKDVTGFARGLEVINKLNPVSFTWKEDGKNSEGLIAQEVQELYPDAVAKMEGKDISEEEKYLTLDYGKLVTPLIKAMQEQQTQIESLTARITTLEG